jgi:hypothetical protein
MDFDEYQHHVDAIPYGKRLPSALYVYRDETSTFGTPLDGMLALAAKAYDVGPNYNVLKFRTHEFKISFLSYPRFFEDPHPVLCKAITIDLVKGKTRRTDYENNVNPPILHRKESFLPDKHPLREQFAALTKAEETAGLFDDTTTIGFKLNWDRLLTEKGLILQGHTLGHDNLPRPSIHGAVPFVERHKTAMTRYELSKPVKSLLEYGMLKPGASLFDYGCGQGSDVRGLRALGYEAEGWDPVFQPDVARKQADIINFGYVLNVIEDPAERLVTLVDAYRHTKRLLVVSALISETVEVGRAARLQDGVLTKRNTFQKFFEQQELQQYIEDALEATAVPVSLGIFYVFRNPTDQQDFLSARSRRVIDWSQITVRLGLGGPTRSQWKTLYDQNRELLDTFGKFALALGRLPHSGEFEHEQAIAKQLGSPKRALRTYVLGSENDKLDWQQVAAQFGIGQPAKTSWEVLYEENKELFDAFWERTLQLGRLPDYEEFPCLNAIADIIGSPKKAIRLFLRRGGDDALKKAAENRRNDLLVYVALANLRKRVPFGHLSGTLRRDIKEFFGNYTNGLRKGLELLYAAGDAGEIELACEGLAIGWQDEQALFFHQSLLPFFPPILRVYVGCASLLYGDVSASDVIKIHKASGKVTFLVYDDFHGKDRPELQHRIKVNLRKRSVEVFDHSSEHQTEEAKTRFLFRPDSGQSVN